MAAPELDLLVIGEINPDLILTGQDVVPAFGQAEKLIDGANLTIGSSSVITACGAARLGLRVAVIGLVGDDEFGRFMLRAMRQRGVDTSAVVIDPAIPTGISVILSQPADRAILTFPGTMPYLRREHIAASILARTRHLHVGSYFLHEALRPVLPDLFAQARARGVSTSLDCNWDPAGEWDISGMLPHLDIFFPNENEVRHITGAGDLQSGLTQLAQDIPTLAVKLGPQGGLAQQGARFVRAPALKVDVVDTTGAGDSFNAGFLYGYLKDYELQGMLTLACACGSLSTRAAGGTAAQPTLAEAQATIAQETK